MAGTERGFYSRSEYGSTPTASTERISSGQLSTMLSNSPPPTNVRLGSRLRLLSQLGQQGNLVLFDDAKPHSITLHLSLHPHKRRRHARGIAPRGEPSVEHSSTITGVAVCAAISPAGSEEIQPWVAIGPQRHGVARLGARSPISSPLAVARALTASASQA